MPWIRFTSDFDFRPRPQVTIAYKAGMHLLVTTACADLAVAKGRAVRQGKPKAKSDEKAQDQNL